MFLIAGLGNPEEKYYDTRHNIGFHIIDSLAEHFKKDSFETAGQYLYCPIDSTGESEDNQIVLIKPLTYMNLSGRALKEFTEANKVPFENILIIYDDINLEFGTLRVRPRGSDGGQNGIKSVIYEMESEFIPRLRVGIRFDEELEKYKDENGLTDLAPYVLSDFTDKEKENLDKVVTAARDAAISFVEKGIRETMNKFNGNLLAGNEKDKDENTSDGINTDLTI